MSTPQNKLQAAAFQRGLDTEYKFRDRLSKELSQKGTKVSSSTLRIMWKYADATKHHYPKIKAVADHFEKSIEELFRT